ncbi:MFS general substrate transporter [Phlegmacium glaucopus]|nr:MFS general substrate transporter [Phlegmacium glaucopus]
MSNSNWQPELKGSGARLPSPQSSVDQNHPVAINGEGPATNVPFDDSAAGVAQAKALRAVWGKSGKKILWLGLALMLSTGALDYSTVYIYQTIATSSFQQLSVLAGIQTSVTIVSAVGKPPIAKLSDVLGRGETYLLITVIYMFSYILAARSSSIGVYTCSAVFYALGSTGIQLLNQVIIADLSTTRWRGFAIGFSYFPGLITPWASGFIIQSITNGIGWRWGIGMFAIMLPVCAVFVIGPLLYYSRKAKKAGLIITKRISLYEFCSLIDLGGIILLCGGFAMLLLPIALSATTSSKWKTPWVDAVLVLGVVFLFILLPYEHFIAKHPVLPLRYFREMAIVSSCLLGFLDAICYSVTHTYLYTWAVVAHNYSPRNATFLLNTNAAFQLLVGLIVGLLMAKTRRYKWLFWIGSSIRVIGYGIMMRLRGANNSTAELFVVQAIQGVGSGVIETIIVVSAQIVLSHAELAQISSLVLLITFLGAAVGQAIAGSIYTNSFPTELHKHLPDPSANTISTLINSILGVLPDWGTPERTAMTAAYSDIMRQMTLVALVISAPTFVCVLFMPDNQLGDAQNLVEVDKTKEAQQASLTKEVSQK